MCGESRLFLFFLSSRIVPETRLEREKLLAEARFYCLDGLVHLLEANENAVTPYSPVCACSLAFCLADTIMDDLGAFDRSQRERSHPVHTTRKCFCSCAFLFE